MNKTTKIIRLKKTNFVESIFDNYGYFCEHIPPCFNTKNFGKFLNLKYDSIHCCYSANDAITFPLEITIAKDGLLRREIYIPLLSCYAIPLLDKLKVFFDPYDDTKKLNHLLKNEIAANHDQEVLWLLFIMIRYESKITVENICEILDGKNDLAIIMVLDIINNHRIYIREYDKKKEEFDRKIEKHIIKLSNALKDEGMYTKRWLLKYEIAYRKFKFNKALKNTNMIKNPVYKIFKSCKIDFYDFPGDPDLVDTSIYI